MPSKGGECPVCRQEFSKWSWGDRQKKQCNKCKRTVCAKCCMSRFLLSDVDPHKPRRVCDECATGGLKAQDIDADTLRLFTGVAKVESTRPVSAPPSLDPTAPTSLSVPPSDRPSFVAIEPPLSPPTFITQPPAHAQAVVPADAPRWPTLQGPMLPPQHQAQGTSDAAVHGAAHDAKPQPEAPEQQPPSAQYGQRQVLEATASVVSKRTEGGAPGVVQPAPMPTNLLAQVRSRRAESATTALPATATSTLLTSSHHPSASTAAQAVELGVAPASSSSAKSPPMPPDASLTRPSPIATAGLFADIQKGKALRTTPTTSDGRSGSMALEERPESGSHAGATTGPSTGSFGAQAPNQQMLSPTAGLLADLQRGKALKKTLKEGEEGKGARGGVLDTKAVSPTAALQQQQGEEPKTAHSRRPSVGLSSGGLSMMQELQMRQERRRMSNSAVSAPSTTETDAATSASPPPANDTTAASSSKPVCPPIIAARRQSGVGGDAGQPAVLRPYQLRRASVEKAAETGVAPGHRTAVPGDSVAELIGGAEGKAGAAAGGAPPSLHPSHLRRASVEKGVDGDGTPEHRAVKSGGLGQLISAAKGSVGAKGSNQIRRPSIEKGVDAEGAVGHRQVRTGSIVAELVKAAEGKVGNARRGSTEVPVPPQGAAPHARASPPPPQGAPPSQAATLAKLRAHTSRHSISQPLDGPMKVPVSMSNGAVDNFERPRMGMNLLADIQKRREG